MTAEEYIKDFTRGCSNELENGEYEYWLTPWQAEAACNLKKEETIEKACEWLKNHNNYQRVLDNGGGVRFDMTQCVIDFRKAMEE